MSDSAPATKGDLDLFKAEIGAMLAEMRTGMHKELSGVRVEMANLRAEYSQRIPLYAGVGGLAGGLIAATIKLF